MKVAAGFSLRLHRLETCATGSEFLVFSTRFCDKPSDFAKEMVGSAHPTFFLCVLCVLARNRDLVRKEHRLVAAIGRAVPLDFDCRTLEISRYYKNFAKTSKILKGKIW